MSEQLMTDAQLIKKIEELWFALQAERISELTKEVPKVPKELRMSLIQMHNKSPMWERRFDALTSALRILDPDHEFLTENQINL